tara:strand:- start:119 stop:517 length:399 start_codon:yes stop_codon:yes gene_type:complete
MDLEIIKIASNTDNHRVLKNHTHNAKLKNPICGDEMEVSIKIAKDNVIDFGYQCKSCVYCQASASLLSENIVNKKILSIKKLLKIVDSFFDKEDIIFPKDWSIFKKIFNKKNISRKECLLLPFKTLKKALKS